MPTRKPARTPASRSATGTDAAEALALLDRCRERQIHVQRIRVGEVEIDGIADLLRFPVASDAAERPASDLREAVGGAALARLARERKDLDESSILLDDS